MKNIDYIIPIILSVFFMSQYFNKKYSKDKKQLFLVIGILVLFINFIRYMTS